MIKRKCWIVTMVIADDCEGEYDPGVIEGDIRDVVAGIEFQVIDVQVRKGSLEVKEVAE